MIQAKQLNYSIPVVDLNDFYSSNKDRFVQEFGQAMREVGFVAVVNTVIDRKKRSRVYEIAKKFFSQDLATKLKLQKQENSGERGYVNIESPKESSIQSRDTKEFLHIGRELSKNELRKLEYPENVWPDNLNLKTPMMELHEDLTRLIDPIAEAASLALGQSATFLGEKMAQGDHLLRIIHYPAALTGQWAAEHTDLNLLTFLPPATCEGLQVKTKNGQWIPVNVPEGSVIINCGDMLQNLTNGEFRSSVHRVERNPLGKERYSIVLFGHTRNDCSLAPLPDSIARTGGMQRYPDATRKELLEYYLVALGRASNEMKQRVAKSGIIEKIGKLDNPHALKIREKVIQLVSKL